MLPRPLKRHPLARALTIAALAGGGLAYAAFAAAPAATRDRPAGQSDAHAAADRSDPRGPMTEAEAVEQMALAADHFLDALSPEQKQKATFEFKDDERLNWHFIPRERKGLPIKEMNPAQRALAFALLGTALSQRGTMSAATIMSLDEVLREMEQGGRGPVRDPERYFFSVFGKPDAKGTWGWRVEGHHLSLNFTIAGGQSVAHTPSFFGANPHEVRQGPRAGLRVLDKEEDLGRQLVKMLSEDQRKKAIVPGDAPKEILLVPDKKKAEKLEPAGISVRDLTPEQREVLKQLVETYARHNRPELAEDDFRKIREAGPENITFAWAGGTEPKQPHYYRVQGPSFVIEYDNTQNNANHVHTVWRDPNDDFGTELLKRHYQEASHDPSHGHDAAK